VAAPQVREYFGATLLPPPLNVLELAANWCGRGRSGAA
jgi:hypothetical protein